MLLIAVYVEVENTVRAHTERKNHIGIDPILSERRIVYINYSLMCE